MLKSLHIENIAVIRRADIDFFHGFSAMTGETGAGKSMIIDSINLLLGNRVSRTVLRTGAEKAVVGAYFEELSPTVVSELSKMGFACDDGTLLLQRTLTSDGKSQTRLNGQAITQAMQKEVARTLVSIHGQSDSQKLLQKGTHLALLDSYVGIEVDLERYRAAFRLLKDTQKEAEQLRCDDAEKMRMREILKFQISDIDALRLKDGEEEQLEKELDRLSNAEAINQRAEQAYRALRGGEKGSAHLLLKRAETALQGLVGLVDGADLLLERLAVVTSEIEDIAETAQGFVDDDREDPTAKIDRIEGRLDAIAKLKRKYGASIAKILDFRQKAQEKLDALDCSEERLSELEKKIAEQTKDAESLALVLTDKRRQAAEQVTREVEESLRFLDMPKVRFSIDIGRKSLSDDGADDVEFMIATNPGEPLQPMTRIASGGELSRIMLALRSVLNDRDGADTVIFDEVDTGVSGKTARKIGIKLKQTADQHTQVLCVTHSAQIASLADTHYRITKSERDGRAETDVECLTNEGRVEEIARILGGIEVTEAQRCAAREMIGEYR